jgi:glycosyltransferase involved in cell wall biosynthesis
VSTEVATASDADWVLPKLLYVGDVPVESSYHGSLSLFRLLEDYSCDDLTILETARPSEPARRLAGVNYISVPLNSRWLNTRFHSIVMAWSSFRASKSKLAIERMISSTKFDAVLTVAHGLGWLVAASVARETNVPLHLIIHDDWPRVVNVPGKFRAWLDSEFSSVYKQAASRICVSPFMRADYLKRYGVDAEVIYPLRAKDCPESRAPASSQVREDRPFTIAFAGTINSSGYLRALQELAESLSSINGRLLLFGPMGEEDARKIDLEGQRLILRGLVPSSELISRLATQADALFVPMSFDAIDRPNMEMAFPSKLADYTATGVPMLIYGPPYCSAVRWAAENRGVAEVVDRQDQHALVKAIRRLSEPSMRVQVGQRGLEVGLRYFTFEVAQDIFYSALKAPTSHLNAPS